MLISRYHATSEVGRFSLETSCLKKRLAADPKLNTHLRLRSMPTPRILIVEDEPMAAMDLEWTIREIIAAEVVVVASVSGAREAMAAPLDFVFLDIQVTDGMTFEIALELRRIEVPFVFVSGASSETLPPRPSKRAIHP